MGAMGRELTILSYKFSDEGTAAGAAQRAADLTTVCPVIENSRWLDTISAQVQVLTLTANATSGRARNSRTTTARTLRKSSDLSSPDRVVESILEGIRAGRYVPGQKLVEADLTHGLGVSRGPVREALKRLAAEGTVILSRHRGAYIRALSRAEADELLLVLEWLTGLMARLAAETVHNGGHGSGLQEAFERLSTYRNGPKAGIDNVVNRRHFYDVLAEIAGNRQLARMLPTMQIHLLRLQTQPYTDPAARDEQLHEYAEITHAVLGGESARAERVMRKHIRRARGRYARIPDEAFSTPAGAS